VLVRELVSALTRELVAADGADAPTVQSVVSSGRERETVTVYPAAERSPSHWARHASSMEDSRILNSLSVARGLSGPPTT
jgi:hypothetical protein